MFSILLLVSQSLREISISFVGNAFVIAGHCGHTYNSPVSSLVHVEHVHIFVEHVCVKQAHLLSLVEHVCVQQEHIPSLVEHVCVQQAYQGHTN